VQIYLMDMHSQEVTQLTTIGGGACQPTWSPDGMRLAFTAPCSDNKRSYDGSTLFIINLDGSGMAPLTFSPIGDYDPAWSPVGNQIAFTTLRDFNRPQIWILDLDSNELTNISDNAGSGVSDFHPAWSPDGQSIVFSSIRGVTNSPNVWVMDTNGENLIELSFSNNRTNLDPDWASDGNIVLYTQFGAQGGGVPAISGMIWRDGNPRAEDEFRVSDLTDSMREPAISPDGFWVAFSGGPDAAQSDLYFMRINGSEVTQLTDTESQEFDPAWRPIP
jgi:Tol biopolymer transport system component